MSVAFTKRSNTILPVAAWSLERLPVVVLPLSVVFLQGYALRFWTGLLGTPGGGVSLGLELLHLWFWNRAAASAGRKRLGWGFLAMAATGLLLAGALHEIAQPFLRESARVEVATRERASLKEEAKVLRLNLDAYRDMAAGQGRRGWREDIRQDTARLTAITRRLSKLSGLPTGEGPPRNDFMLWVVIAVAVLFQVGVILAVWSLSGNSRNTEISRKIISDKSRNAETNFGDISGKPETFRHNSKSPETSFYGQLWKRIEAHAQANREKLVQCHGKVTQAGLAVDLGIGAPDLSAIKLLGQGEDIERKPARASVKRLAEMFAVDLPK